MQINHSSKFTIGLVVRRLQNLEIIPLQIIEAHENIRLWILSVISDVTNIVNVQGIPYNKYEEIIELQLTKHFKELVEFRYNGKTKPVRWLHANPTEKSSAKQRVTSKGCFVYNLSETSSSGLTPDEYDLLMELGSTELEMFIQSRNDNKLDQQMIPIDLLNLNLRKLGFIQTDFDPEVPKALQGIITDMTSKTLSFAAKCAKRAEEKEVSAMDVAAYLHTVYDLNIPGYGETYNIATAPREDSQVESKNR